MTGGPLQATRPVQRLMKVVLSNGASLQMPTPALKTRAYLATQDMFQHSAWTVRVAGYQAADSERLKKVDFSKFYDKFSGGGKGGGARR